MDDQTAKDFFEVRQYLPQGSTGAQALLRIQRQLERRLERPRVVAMHAHIDQLEVRDRRGNSAQVDREIVHVARADGIFRFDGERWTKLPAIPEETADGKV